jgi:hypothetical protein
MRKRKILASVLLAVLLSGTFLEGCSLYSILDPDYSLSATKKTNTEPNTESAEDSGEATIETAAASEETSPAVLWEYSGYLDECEGYTWKNDFVNRDYDGDSKLDRLKREYDSVNDVAHYTLEFGNEDLLVVPPCWSTGFPHVQNKDLDEDGVNEILFTLSYDTSTDPYAYGDLWLFDKKENSKRYSEVELPFASGENGAKGFNIDYEKPANGFISYSLKEMPYTGTQELSDEFVSSWWTDDAVSKFCPIYYAVIKEKESPVIRCYFSPLSRSGECLAFDLKYVNGRYQIGKIEADHTNLF